MERAALIAAGLFAASFSALWLFAGLLTWGDLTTGEIGGSNLLSEWLWWLYAALPAAAFAAGAATIVLAVRRNVLSAAFALLSVPLLFGAWWVLQAATI